MVPTLLGWMLLAACPPSAYDQNLVGQLDREVLALGERNKALEARLEDCSASDAPASELFTELMQVFSGSEVLVERRGVRTLVTIPGSVLFSPGRVDVRQEAEMVLDLLATGLKLHPEQHIMVIGHTDDQALSGSLRRRYGSNFELSALRAASFMRHLVDRFGVDRTRFTIAGRGPMDPLVSNDTPEGRAQNRRIQLVVGPPEPWQVKGPSGTP